MMNNKWISGGCGDTFRLILVFSGFNGKLTFLRSTEIGAESLRQVNLKEKSISNGNQGLLATSCCIHPSKKSGKRKFPPFRMKFR